MTAPVPGRIRHWPILKRILNSKGTLKYFKMLFKYYLQPAFVKYLKYFTRSIISITVPEYSFSTFVYVKDALTGVSFSTNFPWGGVIPNTRTGEASLS